MVCRVLYGEEKKEYDRVVDHPVQTWMWGDFQASQGHRVYRIGKFEKEKLVSGFTISFHLIPRTGWSVGTVLRSKNIDETTIEQVKKIALEQKALFVKFEPETIRKIYLPGGNTEEVGGEPGIPGLLVSPKSAFYPHTFLVDLTKSESEMLEAMHPKTRYNIKIANRYGVRVEEKTNDEGFEIYLKLLFETTKRQGFYLHSQDYHRQLWQRLKATDMPHILIAYYQDKAVAAFMLLGWKKRWYYPYGASVDESRQVMAPNLLMWEAMKLGKKLGYEDFDMWGCLGPGAKEGEVGFGFHRFKQGYGGKLVEYIGSYDLVVDHRWYSIYNLADKYRWRFLRAKANFSRFADIVLFKN